MSGFDPVVPMEPQLADDVPAGDEWIHQIKWDGVRLLLYADGGSCRLFNRKGRERTLNYPELTDRKGWCSARSVILDGEVIALGADGKPSFHEVMRRDGVRRADRMEAARRSVSIAYMVFDLLYVDGSWQTDAPLSERQSLLGEVLKPGDIVQTVPSYADGTALFGLVQQMGLEGIVSKNKTGSYKPGVKDGRWRKIKNYRDLIAVIGGFTLNGGFVNAVLVGLYDASGALHFIGHVGTGRLTRDEWRGLTDLLRPTVTLSCPFVRLHPDMHDPVWVTPRFTVKLQYAEWRREEGRSLRQPSLIAFSDLPPEACVFQDG